MNDIMAFTITLHTTDTITATTTDTTMGTTMESMDNTIVHFTKITADIGIYVTGVLLRVVSLSSVLGCKLAFYCLLLLDHISISITFRVLVRLKQIMQRKLAILSIPKAERFYLECTLVKDTWSTKSGDRCNAYTLSTALCTTKVILRQCKAKAES